MVGDILTGASSGATGEVAYVSDEYLALTNVTGTFSAEQIIHAGTPIGMAQASTPDITAEQDNVLYAAAAEAYRVNISKVPGSGPVRGIAALGSTLYAWRDNAGGTVLRDPQVNLGRLGGGADVLHLPVHQRHLGLRGRRDPDPGRRVGDDQAGWCSSPGRGARARLASSSSRYRPAELHQRRCAGSGACTLSSVPATSALAQIALLPGGKVEAEVFNFLGGSGTKRLYGCDGVNPSSSSTAMSSCH